MAAGPTGPLCILHFNDVYELAPNAQGGGGAARFQSLISKVRRDTAVPSVTLFSGDALSPSLLSVSGGGRLSGELAREGQKGGFARASAYV